MPSFAPASSVFLRSHVYSRLVPFFSSLSLSLSLQLPARRSRLSPFCPLKGALLSPSGLRRVYLLLVFRCAYTALSPGLTVTTFVSLRRSPLVSLSSVALLGQLPPPAVLSDSFHCLLLLLSIVGAGSPESPACLASLGSGRSGTFLVAALYHSVRAISRDFIDPPIV